MHYVADARLNAVLNEICCGDKVADIGCDHGIVANLAVQITKDFVYAIDISAPSLKKAEQMAVAMGQSDKVICRTGDGLDPVEKEDIDTIVIAGMGGHEIIKILSRAKHRYKKYVLVPHRDARLLREYLVANGYGVQNDTALISDKKYYWVITASGNGNANYTLFESYFGKTDNDARKRYVDSRYNYLKNLLPKTNGERFKDILTEINIIEVTNED